MIKKFLGFFLLVIAMAGALIIYSTTTTVSETQGTVAKHIQKAKAEVLAIAIPTLRKFGIDVERVQTEDMNVVERQMENAADKVTEATNALSQ